MKYFTLLVLMVHTTVFAQQRQETVQRIFDYEMKDGKCYQMLDYLCNQIGHRLSGSTGAAAAVEYTRMTMKNFADSVKLQPVMVPHWVRGARETGRILTRKAGPVDVRVCALGGSVGTGTKGLSANVVEVKSFDELKVLGTKGVQGKIVFFNRPLDPTQMQTFAAYSGAVNQRGSGASEAARYGALGVVVRSMGWQNETYPHTGSLRYDPMVPKIPALAISTKDADVLSSLLAEEKDLKFYMESNCETLPDAPSFNVIGEIRGSEFPDEIIVVGGHLDSWDLGQGAHDDGAGCVQSMEVLRLLKAIGYRPRRTIRAVMYMNEENGLRGGVEYARVAGELKEKHIAAIESDRGGFTPRGFSMTAPDALKAKVKAWEKYFEKYGLTDFDGEGGGADIGPLGPSGTALFGYVPDSQRYFSYHHTEEDTFDKVNRRELELGAAAMAALVYLIDQEF